MRRYFRLLFVLCSLLAISSPTASANPAFASNISMRESGRSVTEGPFKVPAKLRGRVDFWKDVFAKYGRTQVVIHHREFPQVVFGVLDFRSEAETMGDVELKRHMDRVEKGTIAAMRQQIQALVAGESPSTPFQKSFVEKMKQVPEPSRSYRRVLDEDLLRTQTGIRERYAEAVSRAWRYLPIMEHVFVSEYGLPKELTRLPFIESSFDYTAYSSVGAAGIWQFMPRTARSHRLTVGKYVDERRDPVKATRAAAEYLRLAYQELGSWPLAITSYNHGVGGVRSKVRQAGTSSITEILEHPSERFFGFASTNFYPEFLAAVEIFEDHERYFPEVAVQPPLRVVAHPVRSPVSSSNAARQLGVSVESLKEANYALLEPVWKGRVPIPAGYVLQVPVQQAEKRSQPRTPEPIRSRIVATAPHGSDGVMHRVSDKDTLERIAERYDTTPDHIARMNRLTSRSVQNGQVLFVPKGGGGVDSANQFPAEEALQVVPVVKAAEERVSVKAPVVPVKKAKSGSVAKRTHKVRSGDTLSSLAKRYGRSVADIKRANNLRGSTLVVGQLVRIP